MLNKEQALKIVMECNPENMDEGEVRVVIHETRYVKHYIHFKMINGEIKITRIAYTRGNSSKLIVTYRGE